MTAEDKIQKVAEALFVADHRGTKLDWQKALELKEAHDRGFTPEYGEAPHYITLATVAVKALS